MKLHRGSGILLHVTSLPSDFGIGDLGPSAYQFVDWLKKSKQKYWQMLPIGITNDDGSPYSGLSAFSGNPLLISPELLLKDAFIGKNDLEKAKLLTGKNIDYPLAGTNKRTLLETAFQNSKRSARIQAEFEKFRNECSDRLNTLALYLTIAKEFGPVWQKWPNALKWREEQPLFAYTIEHSKQLDYFLFEQFLFFKQWNELKAYANQNGIKLIGDIPIFSSSSSADIWQNPEWYYLDESGYPYVVSGAPPDSFSTTGQKWGNPLYRWDLMKETHFSWWAERIEFMTGLFDIVRIDHFRGFESYWEIPASENDACKGKWIKGPGHDLFNQFKKRMGDLPLIAEDLGFITEEVHRLRADFDLPSMKILQFAFESDHHHPYLPQHLLEHSVVYTGTHDNNTSIGWLQSATPHERWMLSHYVKNTDRFNWEMIKMALHSKSDTAIIPLQDVIGVGSEGRMNSPGSDKGNWGYHFKWNEITESMTSELIQITEHSGRTP